MLRLHQLLTFAAVVAACATISTAHQAPVPHIDTAPVVMNGPTLGLSVGFAAPQPQPQSHMRHLRAQHNGEDHSQQAVAGGAPANAIAPGGGDINPNTGVKNPGGILGPLYAAFPDLLAPLAMASDNVHNSNAAVSGVQHTPDGIFQA